MQSVTASEVLERLGIEEINSGAGWGEWIEKPSGGELVSFSPGDGSPIASVAAFGSATKDYGLTRTVAETTAAIETRHDVSAVKSTLNGRVTPGLISIIVTYRPGLEPGKKPAEPSGDRLPPAFAICRSHEP